MKIKIFALIVCLVASLLFIPLLDTGSVPYVYGYENLLILFIAMFDLIVFASLFS
jgi:hypothetical protein